jgi:hypothetical protein
VERLFQDVSALVAVSQDWRGDVIAPRTIGENVPVSAWHLGEHFLLAYHDWHWLRERFRRYFGEDPTEYKIEWSDLDTRCRDLASRLLRESLLDELVAKSWGTQFLPHADQPSVTPIFHAIVANHRRISLLGTSDSREIPPAGEPGSAPPQGPSWPRSFSVARHLNKQLITLWNTLEQEVRGPVMWHLRQYQRANLLASWLVAMTPLGSKESPSALIHALRSDRIVPPDIERLLSSLSVEDNIDQTRRVLHRVVAVVADFGYDNFIEDVTSDEFLGGEDSPVGSNAVMIVPGKERGAGGTTLLAVSKGSDAQAAFGFPNVMPQVNTRLRESTGKTWLVIFLVDHLSPAMLAPHLVEWRAHHRGGLPFLFLKVGTSGRDLAPVGLPAPLVEQERLLEMELRLEMMERRRHDLERRLTALEAHQQSAFIDFQKFLKIEQMLLARVRALQDEEVHRRAQLDEMERHLMMKSEELRATETRLAMVEQEERRQVEVARLRLESQEADSPHKTPPIPGERGSYVLWLLPALVPTPRFVHFSWGESSEPMSFKIRDFIDKVMQHHPGGEPRKEGGFNITECPLDRDGVWRSATMWIPAQQDLLHPVSDFDWWEAMLREMTANPDQYARRSLLPWRP